MRQLLFSWLFFVVLGLSLLYAGLAFINLSLRPGDWAEQERAVFVVMALLWIAGITLLAVTRIAENSDEE